MSKHRISGKLGNMRKAVEWSIYPARDADNPERIIQCDKRIARINLETGKAMLSNGKGGHNGFMHLNPIMGAVEVDVPQEMIDELKGKERHVGPVNIMDLIS